MALSSACMRYMRRCRSLCIPCCNRVLLVCIMNADVMERDGFTVVKRRGKSRPAQAKQLPAAHQREDDEGPDESAVQRRIAEAETDIKSSAVLRKLSQRAFEVPERVTRRYQSARCRLLTALGTSPLASMLGTSSRCSSVFADTSIPFRWKSTILFSPRKSVRYWRRSVSPCLARNDEGKRAVRDGTLFYMPHCGTPLYNSVLWANWDPDSLGKVVVFGNSFDTLWTNKLDSTLRKKCGFLVNVRPAVREFAIANDFKYSDVFNDLSLHAFDATRLHADAWSSREEPMYDGEDEIILALEEKCRI
ncbi:hypothetical protein MTO96_003573 [Rhipicephalus appendiculatus]